MKVLGLCTMGNSAACIVIDGFVISAIEEERLSRIKNDGGFPLKAIKRCMSDKKISFKEIDAIAVYWQPWRIFTRVLGVLKLFLENPFYIKYFFSSILQSFFGYKKNNNYPELSGSWLELFFIRSKLQSNFENFDEFKGKIYFLDHHECHAASSAFISGFSEKICLTFDGGGESISTAIFLCDKNQNLKKIKSLNWPNSLGHFYSAFTGYLGFRMLEGEYKMMGLAPYGNPKYKDIILDNILLKKNGGNYYLNTKILNYHMALNGKFSSELVRLFGPPRKKSDVFSQKHKDIASSVQSAFEEILLHMLKWVKSEYSDYNNLCIAGGCALNVTANGKVTSRGLFDQIFIPPGPHDAGSAIGAAFLVERNNSNKTEFTMKDAYTGPSYDDSFIINTFKKLNLSIPTKMNEMNLLNFTSKKLAEGQVIAWFQSSSEFGPRALGNRSFLADPRYDNIRETINQKIKKRELFRPFAPSCKLEVKNTFFEINQDSPFMNIVANVKKEKMNIIPAVTHTDGTARVHTVSRETNELYWKLLDQFEKITGVGVLLNTSFNIQEPIVESPLDAINCFLRSKVDVLIIGNYVCDANWRSINT